MMDFQLYQVHSLKLAEGFLSFDCWNAFLFHLNTNSALIMVNPADDPLTGVVSVEEFAAKADVDLQIPKNSKNTIHTFSPLAIDYSILCSIDGKMEEQRFTHTFRGNVSLSYNWVLSARISTGLFRSYQLNSIVHSKVIPDVMNGTQFIS